MAKADGGELIARVMRENRVKYCFAINGGHLFPILAQLRNHDIKLIHMRHEQATAYAADAYARVSGEPGVCMVTAGCGLTNAVTGLCVAGLTNSAVVCISGQHPNTEDHLGSFQEAYGSEVVHSFSKFTKRVTDWSTIQFDLRSAFREAISPPQGVALFEVPQNLLYHHDEDGRQRRGARGFTLDDVRCEGDPARIDRAVEVLHAAERPLIAGGDGLFWSQAGAEMKEFVELTGIAGDESAPEGKVCDGGGGESSSFAIKFARVDGAGRGVQGHVEEERAASGCQRAAAGFRAFPISAAGFVEVQVDVDESGQDCEARSIDRVLRRREFRGYCNDPLVFDGYIGGQDTRRSDNAPLVDGEVRHCG